MCDFFDFFQIFFAQGEVYFSRFADTQAPCLSIVIRDADERQSFLSNDVTVLGYEL